MSHFTKIKTLFVDQDALVSALNIMGYINIEIHDSPQNLYGYSGDLRKDVAEIIIRRKYIGSASNDIGFKKNENGYYEAIISEYDRNIHNDFWINKLSQQYALISTKQELKKKGFSLKEEKLPNGTIRLFARKLG